MSFMLTMRQMRAKRKTVTRRMLPGWSCLEVGDFVRAVEKCMGLAKGQPMRGLGIIRIESIRVERLDAIDAADVVREGFPEATPAEFVAMFCRHMKCGPAQPVRRIEFSHATWAQYRDETIGAE